MCRTHTTIHLMPDTRSLTTAERAYYQRQMRLPELGEEGQRRLKAARVLVVGAGGLGSPALLHLAAAGIGFLRICEHDQLEVHNLHRQTLYAHEHVGRPKGRLACRRLQALNPHARAEWAPLPFAPERAAELLSGIDLALDCADSLNLSFQMNRACRVAGIPLVSAAVHRWEGQLLTIDPAAAEAGCLRCLWPEMPPEPGACADTGILGTVPGLLGTLQAQEALKLLLDLPGDLRGHLLLVDTLNFSTRRLARARRAGCPVCDTHAARTGESDAASAPANEIEVDPLSPALEEWRGRLLVDLREEGERGFPVPAGHDVLRRPLSALRFPAHGLPDRELLVICAHGVRSLWATTRLRALGHTRCWSLRGGMEGLREKR